MSPNSLEYQKSIAREFDAYKNRVRNLIGSAHWGEEGRYKEIILINFLRRFLPNTVSVGTGFIKDGDRLSTQIDIVIYDPSLPVYFKEADFVIVQPNSVLGIIEVKSNPAKTKIGDAISKATENGRLIQNYEIFNGLFIYGKPRNDVIQLLSWYEEPVDDKFHDSLQQGLKEKNSVNHIVSLDGVFIKKWKGMNYSCYGIKDLSVSYFFSNLLEHIDTLMGTYGLPKAMREHLYSIPEGKVNHLRWELGLKEEPRN